MVVASVCDKCASSSRCRISSEPSPNHANARKNSFVSISFCTTSDGAVLAQFHGLSAARDRHGDEAAQRERKFYQMAWEPRRHAGNDRNRARGSADLLRTRTAFGASLADFLRTRKISAASGFCRCEIEPREWQRLAVDLRQEGLGIRFVENTRRPRSTSARIVYLWSAADVRSREKHGCSTLLALTQARLAIAGSEDPARWLVVTRGAQVDRRSEQHRAGAGSIVGIRAHRADGAAAMEFSLVDAPTIRQASRCCASFSRSNRAGSCLARRRALGPSPPRSSSPKLSGTIAIRPPTRWKSARPGRADSLQFRGRARRAPGAGEVEIEVAAAGLNFRDLMKVLGIYPLREGEPAMFGDECSGRVLRVGPRCAEIQDRATASWFRSLGGGTFSSHVVESDRHRSGRFRTALGFAEAASIPVVFGTAFHGLRHAGAPAARRNRPDPRRRRRRRPRGGATRAADWRDRARHRGQRRETRLPPLARRGARDGFAHARFRRRNASPHRRPRRRRRPELAGRRVSAKEPRDLRAARALRRDRQARPFREQRAPARRLPTLALVLRLRSARGPERPRGNKRAAERFLRGICPRQT